MAAQPDVYSYFDPKLMISLELPAGWEIIAAPDDGSELAIFAPPEKGYRAHLSVYYEGLEPASPEELENLIQQTYYETYPQLRRKYKLLEAYTLPVDGFAAFAAHYHWSSHQARLDFAELDLLVLAREGAFYKFFSYSLQSLESHYLPVFELMLASLRFIPHPSGS